MGHYRAEMVCPECGEALCDVHKGPTPPPDTRWCIERDVEFTIVPAEDYRKAHPYYMVNKDHKFFDTVEDAEQHRQFLIAEEMGYHKKRFHELRKLLNSD